MPGIDITPPLICDALVLPSLPTLPSGISLGVAVPGIGTTLSIRLCCKTLFFDQLTLTPPVSLGVGAVVPVVVALNTFITAINIYKRSLPVLCPRE